MRNSNPNFREQFSTVTAFIDASTVYGSDDRFAALLREDIFSFTEIYSFFVRLEFVGNSFACISPIRDF
jgi:hypothetical protein